MFRKKCIGKSVIALLLTLLIGIFQGISFPVTIVKATDLSDFNITGATVKTINSDNFDVITFTADRDYSLTKNNITITDNTQPSLYPMVISVDYDGGSGLYSVTVNDLNYFDTYTLTITKDGYNTYTNTSVYYGTIATASDIDVDNNSEKNIFDTYTRSYDPVNGVLTVTNTVYADSAVLYPNPDTSSLYYKINSNNGHAVNGAGSYRVIGAFVVAPLNARYCKSLGTSGAMSTIGDTALISKQSNHEQTVADSVGTAYENTVYAYPAYLANAVKLDDDTTWMLYDQADRTRVIEWYDSSMNLLKVVRFTVKVEYKADGAVMEKPAEIPTTTPAAITVSLGSGDGLILADTNISGFDGSWDGGSLTVTRANVNISQFFFLDSSANDVFTINSDESVLYNDTVNKSLYSGGAGGTKIADWTLTNGKLTVTFNNSATDTDVKNVLNRIQYSNATPYGDAKIVVKLNDGTSTVYSFVDVTSDTIYVDQVVYDAGMDAADGYNLAEALKKAEEMKKTRNANAQILIQDGIYQGQFLATTPVTIDAVNGASGNVTLKSPASASLSKSLQDMLTANGRWRVPILELRLNDPASGTITVRNITVDGDFQGYSAEGKDLLGIAIFNTNAVIDHVTIEKIACTPDINGDYGGIGVNYGILAEGASNLSARADVTIRNCTINTYQKAGILAWGPKLNMTITNNSISGVGEHDRCGQNGMQIGSSGLRTSTTAVISGNTISNLSFDNSTYFATGILLRQADDVEVNNNTISGNGTAFETGAGVTCGIDLMEMRTSAYIHDNTMEAMQYGICVEAYDNQYIGSHSFVNNSLNSTYYAFFDKMDNGDPSYDEANAETITVNSGATVNNGLGYALYQLYAGDDTFTDTGSAPSRIDGGAGSDTISAGSGNDTLIGGAGDDTLTGGGGSDIFYYEASGSGIDVIKDFGVGDIIRVAGRSSAGGTVTQGSGSSVAANSVQVSVYSNGTTTLYIDTNGTAGAPELQIKLTGEYQTNNFGLDDTDIRYISNAAAPSITVNPTDMTVSVGGTANLSVAASGGVSLSYQWYSNTSNSNSGGSLISGATNSTYSAPTTAVGTTYYYCVVTNTDSAATGNKTEIAKTNAVKVTVNAVTPHNSDGSGTTGTGSAGVDIQVNGKTEKAGTATTSTNINGQTVTTISVDGAKLEQKLNQEGDKAVVTIPVNTKSDVVVGELNGQIVKAMETKQAVLEIKTEAASYTLPAAQINIAAVSAQIGTQVQLQDIKVSIEIAMASSETAKVVENAAKAGEFTIVAPPVEFIVKCTSGEKTVSVSSFNAYVERMVAIPAGVDPSKITTGVVVEPDGTVRHVPTRVVQIDGKYYAKINSLTNSTYSVVWHPYEFKDAANHWAKEDINDMGSRMVVSGVGNDLYEPDRNITRAEFAAIMVKALGLKPGEGSNPFKDVASNEWYADYIKTAYARKIIAGYDEATFGPNDKITREQAMAMINRAMGITGLKVELTDAEKDRLLSGYTDGSLTSGWARSNVAACVKAGIVSGRGTGIVAPRENITRAEVAVIVKRLLQKSNLI